MPSLLSPHLLSLPSHHSPYPHLPTPWLFVLPLRAHFCMAPTPFTTHPPFPFTYELPSYLVGTFYVYMVPRPYKQDRDGLRTLPSGGVDVYCYKIKTSTDAY